MTHRFCENLGTLKSAKPQVSVVVPTYNRARDLIRCLDSLVKQTYREFEVLVCDDGSTDDTREVVSRYADRLSLRYHWAENFGGPARPRNIGIGLSHGKYTAFLDSDDWWLPAKLAESVARLDEGVDIVYHDLYLAWSHNQRFYWLKRGARALAAPVFEDLITNGNAICNSSVVVRREILDKIGGFSEERALIAWEDYDAWLRVAKVTDRFSRIDKSLGYCWRGGGNISSPRRVIGNLEKFRERYIASDPSWRNRPLPAWYHYGLGLANYTLGSHALAREQMRLALQGRLPRRSRTKARFFMAAATGRLIVARQFG